MVFKRHALTFKTTEERKGKVPERLQAVAMLSDLSHYFFSNAPCLIGIHQEQHFEVALDVRKKIFSALTLQNHKYYVTNTYSTK